MARSRIDHDEIVDTVLGAVVESTADRGDGKRHLAEIARRSEASAQSYLALRLNDRLRDLYGEPDGLYVTIESRTCHMDGWVFDDDFRPHGRPPGKWKGGEKFDLAVWGNDEFLIGLIELKNAPGQHDGAFVKDAKKLFDALRRWGSTRGGSLHWGLYVFSIRVSSMRHKGHHRQWLSAKLDARLAALRMEVGAEHIGIHRHKPADTTDNCALWWCCVAVVP